MANGNQNKAVDASTRPSTTGVAASVAPVASAAAGQPNVVVHKVDEALLKEIKRTAILAGIIAGKAFRSDVKIAPGNVKQIAELADQLLEHLG